MKDFEENDVDEVDKTGFYRWLVDAVDKTGFFRWLEKRTYGHPNFEINPARDKMIGALKPLKESLVEHFKRASFEVLEEKGIILSHGTYFHRVVGIYLLEKIIQHEKYKFIAAPEVVIFPLNWKSTDDHGWFVAAGPAFTMEYIHGVNLNMSKEQQIEIQDFFAKGYYSDGFHTKNGPNFIFDKKRIVCVDTERFNFPNGYKLGELDHSKCQRTLLLKIQREDDDKAAVETEKIDNIGSLKDSKCVFGEDSVFGGKFISFN